MVQKAKKPHILIFASGFPEGDRGGRSAVDLVLKSRIDELEADVIGIVTDHQDGTVEHRARQKNVPCFLFPSQGTACEYKRAYNILIHTHRPALTVFCGWTKPVYTFPNPTTTINALRGLRLGDESVSYYNAPEAEVARWFVGGGRRLETYVTINFVAGPTVDNGPPIATFTVPVHIRRGVEEITPQRIIAMVRQELRNAQQFYLPQVINHILLRHVRWEGILAAPVIVPDSYRIKTDPRQCMVRTRLYPYEQTGYGFFERTIDGESY